MIKKLPTWCFILWGVTANNLVASEFDNASLMKLSLKQLLSMKVKGASRSDYDLQTVPANVIIFNRARLQSLGIRDLSELMAHLPGIDLVDNDHWYGEHYTVRGVPGNDRFLVLIDGHKLNVPSGFHLSVGNSIALDYADKVEVIYGPASVVYGTDAFSMVINIVTESGKEDHHFRMGYGAGEDSTHDWWIEGRYQWKEQRWLKAYLRHYQSDGFEFSSPEFQTQIANYQAPNRAQFEQPIDDYNLLVEGQFDEWQFGVFRQSYNEGNARGLGESTGPGIAVYNKENRWQFQTDKIWLAWQQENDNRQWHHELIYTDYALDDSSQFLEFADVATYSQTNSFFKTGEDTSLELTSSVELTYDDGTHLLVGGKIERIKSLPPYANEIVFADPAIPYSGDAARLMREQTTLWETKAALFTEFEIPHNSQWSTLVGLRYDYSRNWDNAFNPRAAVVYKHNEDSVFKLVFGTAFQSPSLNFLNEQWGNQFIVMLPNDEQDFVLKNQRMKSLELIWQKQVFEQSLLTVSLFYNDMKDLINRVLYSDAEFNRYANDITPALRFENIGRQKSSGLDLVLKGQLDEFWQYYIYYSYLDATVMSDVEFRLPSTSQHKMWSGLTYQADSWSLGADIKWIDDPATSPNSVMFPGNQMGPNYTLVDLNGQYHVDENWRLFAHINNLFDDDIDHVGFNDGPGSGRMSLIPQPGREVVMGFELRY